MKRFVRLTESDLIELVKKVLYEQDQYRKISNVDSFDYLYKNGYDEINKEWPAKHYQDVIRIPNADIKFFVEMMPRSEQPVLIKLEFGPTHLEGRDENNEKQENFLKNYKTLNYVVYTENDKRSVGVLGKPKGNQAINFIYKVDSSGNHSKVNWNDFLKQFNSLK